MNFSNEYIEDFITRMAYHSCSLEGQHITLPETVSIILYNTVPKKISLNDLYAIDNHKYACSFLLNQYKRQKKLSMNMINEFHNMLTYRTQKNHKHYNNYISSIENLINETYEKIHTTESKDEIINIVAAFHIEFMYINSFKNGRTDRFIMNYLLIQHRIAPVVIHKKEKELYDICVKERSLNEFLPYLHEKINIEYNRM